MNEEKKTDQQIDCYNYFHDAISTVAIYGKDEPNFFHGHLILKRFYKDQNKTEVDEKHTQDYMISTLFYETNKVVRSIHHDYYDENQVLAFLPMAGLGDQYRLVYNLKAAPGRNGEDNGLAFLQDKDPNARGLAIILKEDAQHKLTWLEETEARNIIKQLNDLI